MSIPVLILGTYHMHNPQADLLNPEPDDILSKQRQVEIERVVNRLRRFKPTKIAVEHPFDDPKMNHDYVQYLAGNHVLQRNEIEQLGFRLAKSLNHTQLYPTDYQNDFDFEALAEYAQHNDQVALVEQFMAEGQAAMAQFNQVVRSSTVGEILRYLNNPTFVAGNLAQHMQLIQVGSGKEYIGTDLLLGQYERNLKIFTNIVRLIEADDRIMGLYGAGHAPFLRQFVQNARDLMLDEPNDYL